MALFWGCFVALITTSYAFFSRMYLCDVRFMADFALTKVAVGELKGAGIWPFGVSIIVFSLIIDKVGYKTAMFFSFVCYVIYCLMAFAAYSSIQGVTGDALVAAQKKGHGLLTWGSIILGLGNGTVEAYVNPLVATVFSKNKTKWLNALHAGWPAGLIVGGLCTIALADVAAKGDWRIVLGLILVPAIISFIMLVGKPFPKSEREQAGVSYLEMLKELGAFGAFVGFGLVFAQVGEVFGWSQGIVWSLIGLTVVIFAVLTKSFGRGILALLIVVMMPLATTELGTDGWISSLMEEPMKHSGFNPGWVLIYTSTIMMVLRFFAGSIVHRISPLGLLAACATLAIIGLTLLSKTATAGLVAVFAAATVYALGKTFFWPTMLGVASEQCPKGGALTLNALGGIGMLAVGILGFPFIGYLQDSTSTKELAAANPAIHKTVTVDKHYLLGDYQAIDPVKAATVTDEEGTKALKIATTAGQFGALGKMAFFPGFMLVCYLGMIAYFKSRGGYKAVDLQARH